MLFKFILIDEIYANIRLWGFLNFLWVFLVKLVLLQGEKSYLAALVKN